MSPKNVGKILNGTLTFLLVSAFQKCYSASEILGLNTYNPQLKIKCFVLLRHNLPLFRKCEAKGNMFKHKILALLRILSLELFSHSLKYCIDDKFSQVCFSPRSQFSVKRKLPFSQSFGDCISIKHCICCFLKEKSLVMLRSNELFSHSSGYCFFQHTSSPLVTQFLLFSQTIGNIFIRKPYISCWYIKD